MKSGQKAGSKSNRIIKSYFLGAVIVLMTVFCLFAIFGNSSADKDIAVQIEGSKTRALKVNLQQLQKSFTEMEKSGWNINEPLVWGYYFYDTDKNLLSLFSDTLKKEGLQTYTVKEKTFSGHKYYLLYVYEKKVYTPSSLLKQVNELTKLAVDNNIEEFDGWEAGQEPL